jgi:hypothetical protein
MMADDDTGQTGEQTQGLPTRGALPTAPPAAAAPAPAPAQEAAPAPINQGPPPGLEAFARHEGAMDPKRARELIDSVEPHVKDPSVRFAAAFGKAGEEEQAPLLKYGLKQADEAFAGARAAMDAGEPKVAATLANAGHSHVVDGNSVSFTPTNDKMVVNVKNLAGGKDSNFALSHDQFKDWINDPQNYSSHQMMLKPGNFVQTLKAAEQGPSEGEKMNAAVGSAAGRIGDAVKSAAPYVEAAAPIIGSTVSGVSPTTLSQGASAIAEAAGKIPGAAKAAGEAIAHTPVGRNIGRVFGHEPTINQYPVPPHPANQQAGPTAPGTIPNPATVTPRTPTSAAGPQEGAVSDSGVAPQTEMITRGPNGEMIRTPADTTRDRYGVMHANPDTVSYGVPAPDQRPLGGIYSMPGGGKTAYGGPTPDFHGGVNTGQQSKENIAAGHDQARMTVAEIRNQIHKGLPTEQLAVQVYNQNVRQLGRMPTEQEQEDMMEEAYANVKRIADKENPATATKGAAAAPSTNIRYDGEGRAYVRGRDGKPVREPSADHARQ